MVKPKNKKTDFDKKTDYASGSRLAFKDIVDSLAKIVGAGAIVFATIIAHNYETKQSAFTLLSQREQAESQLRTSMFSDLIDPITGSHSRDKISVERERLLVELLLLNFHEHFEFKPLLWDVDQRLLKNTEGMSRDNVIKQRKSLRSIAHRVVSRQIALLIKDGAKEAITLEISELNSNDNAERITIKDLGDDNLIQDLLKNKIIIKRADAKLGDVRFNPDIKDERELIKRLTRKQIKNKTKRIVKIWRQPGRQIFQLPTDKSILMHFSKMNGTYISEKVTLMPPGKRKHPVEVTISNPDWENQTVEVSLTIKTGSPASPDTTTKNFTLTSYDMPFTDNTLLPDGYRFSLVLWDMDKEISPKAVNLKFVWFPQNYFPPRERPISNNYFQTYLNK